LYNIIAFIGPSASGKTTLQKHLGLDKIVTHTSRPPRSGEIDGVTYHFSDKEKIINMFEQGLSLQCTEYYGFYYSTEIKSIQEVIDENRTASLVIDAHGAKVLKDNLFDKVLIVGVAASYDECKERLAQRGQGECDLRLQKYNEEYEELLTWSDIIINNSKKNWGKSIDMVKLFKYLK